MNRGDVTTGRTRGLRDIGSDQPLLTRRYPVVVNRWALIVGVSQYQHADWNLEFADEDARSLVEFIQTPAGGGFEADKILALIDSDATTAEVTKGLRTFLKKPDRNDIVLLYFACHGAPDPDRPDNLYLLTTDAQPDDISGTAVPMREVELALKETLLAERVVMLADTCHSGSLMSGLERRRQANADAAVMNAYLQTLSESRPGVALLTSAEATETSREGEEWGGGHGVFTHFLLEGLKGAADGFDGRPRDGKVTVRELFEYVREQVKESTDGGQHPVIGPHVFDENLPMSITGELDSKDYCELALRLEELAYLCDEPTRYRAAAAHYAESLALSLDADACQQELGHARSLLGAGAVDEARTELERLIARDEAMTMPEARFLLGLVHSRKHEYEAAATQFHAFVEAAGDHVRAPLLRIYIGWLEARTRLRKFALLIGINEYRAGNEWSLTGCVSDVDLLEKALCERCDFDTDLVNRLTDQAAVHRNILAALAGLARETGPEDQVLISFSGHSLPESQRARPGTIEVDEIYLLVHDTVMHTDGHFENGLTARELHDAVKSIPARHKTLLLDTHPSDSFLHLAESDGDYVLLLGSETSDSNETQVLIDGERRSAGLFTTALSTTINQHADPLSLNYGDLIKGALANMRQREFTQVPRLVGDDGLPAFIAEDIYLSAYEFSRRRNYSAFTRDSLEARYRRIATRLASPFPEFHYSMGIGLLECDNHEAAIEALKIALDQCVGEKQHHQIGLVRALVEDWRDHDAARVSGESGLFDETRFAAAPRLKSALDALCNPKRRVLLVGIDQYTSEEVSPAIGSVNDVLLMKHILQERWQYAPGDIVCLTNKEATRGAILSAFADLCTAARDSAAIFYFSGNGSTTPELDPTLLAADSRCDNVFDIEIKELSDMAAGTNLVAVLDTGWCINAATKASTVNSEPGGAVSIDAVLKTSVPDLRKTPTIRGPTVRGPALSNYGWVERSSSSVSDALRVGSITVYYADALPSAPSPPATLVIRPDDSDIKLTDTNGGEFVCGKLTYALARALLAGDAPTDSAAPSYARLYEVVTERADTDIGIAVSADSLEHRLSDNFTARSEALDALDEPRQSRIRDTIVRLQRLFEERREQGDEYPRGLVDLGMSFFALGEYENAVAVLKDAVELYSDQEESARQAELDIDAEFRAEAHYQLGRSYYMIRNNLSRAVNELNTALELTPDNTRVLYYLGQTIREMVKRESLTKAESVLKQYIERGAPLGQEQEVRAFLKERSQCEVIE